MIRQDDRTPEQMGTHTVVIGGTDRFMSGWGHARGGVSVASGFAGRLRLAAPQMAAVYERTFGVSLRSRVASLIEQYPNVTAPNWISWEGHRITNISTTAKLRTLLAALDGAK